MTDLLLFHLLAIMACASFGLLAIWAAVGRSAWLLRFGIIAAVIGSLIPVPAFDVAVGAVSQSLVIAVAFWTVRRFRFMQGKTLESRPDPADRWLRFSMSDLLRATLLIAGAFAVAAYMPDEERRSWWKYALTGSRFGAATLVGAWAALSRRRLWARLGVLCVAAPLVAGGRWWDATLCVGLLVAAWIRLARRSGLLSAAWEMSYPTVLETSRQGSRVFRPPVVRAALGALSLAMLSLPMAAYYDMLHAVPIPVEPLPKPNAYDEVLRIAVLLATRAPPGLAGSIAGGLEVSPEQRRSVLFEQLHAALRRPSAVPIRYAASYTNLEAIQALRQLSRDLHAEGGRQRMAEKTSAALQIYQDLFELGLVTARGGFMVDRLVGTAIADMGIDGLRQLRDELSFDERRTLIAALQANEAAWEPLDNVHARDCAAIDKIGGWRWRIRFAFPDDWRPGTQAAKQADLRRVTKIRLLVCHLAVCQYRAEHRRPPRDLAELVPDYLSRVPEDPFSNRPLVYKPVGREYLLYSVNQDGRDEGGRRSESPLDGDLFLDPAESGQR